MYLKSVEIVGFKSFADKTKLDFKPGMSAIIGPNGSGKCVHGDTIVELADGRRRAIRDIVEERLSAPGARIETWDDGLCAHDNPENLTVLSLNRQTLKLERRSVVGFVRRTAPGFLLRIRTRSGRKLTATHYHPLFTLDDGTVRTLKAQELKPGMSVALPRRLPTEGARVRLDPEATLSAFQPIDPVYVPDQGAWNATRGRRQAARLSSLNAEQRRKVSRLCSARGGAFNLPAELDEDLGRFLGYVISEGRLTRSNQVWFVNSDDAVVAEFRRVAGRIFGLEAFVGSDKPACKDVLLFSRALCLYLDRVFGMTIEGHSSTKKVPEQLFGAPLPVVRSFLSGLFEGDGYLERRSSYWEYSTASQELAKGVASLLLRLGIFGTIRASRKAATNGSRIRRTYYSVFVYGAEQVRSLACALSFVGDKRVRLEAARAITARPNPNQDLIPGVTSAVRSLVKAAGISVKAVRREQPTLAAYYEQRCEASRPGLARTLDFVRAAGRELPEASFDALRTLADSDVYWDRIESVERAPAPEWVYDLSVAETHNFVADGFIVHNSNVNEAIRWCIGEMSWKSLRSTAMVDVIFAGTARRPALNMAEVVLTFDNTKGMLPMPYSEITVSRKLFRSGESEYYLNKTQCRLRDIRELFLDTGLGNDGYAIIDQGGVDFVIKAKPEDRRALFEEAAGVSKYKAKREEALRKLDRVEQDLARLNDSMALINEQIRKLDSDARKAKLFQKYKEELTGLEVAAVLAEVSGTQESLEREAAAIQPVRESYDARKLELDAQEGRAAALALERTGVQAQAAEANQALAEVKAGLSMLSERQANNTRASEELRRRDASARGEIDLHKKRLEDLEPELGRAQGASDAAAAKERDAQAAVSSFLAEAEGLERQFQDAVASFEELKAKALEASRRTTDAANGLASSESKLSRLQYDLEQSLKDLERQARKAEARRAELDERLAGLLEARLWLSDAGTVAGSLEEAASGFQLRRGAVDEELSQTRSETVVLKTKVETLAAQGSQDPYWAGSHAAASAGLPGVLGTVRSLIKVEEPFARMVEDVLGERLYALVCEDSSSAQAAVGFLRETGNGRARILVLSAVGDSAPQTVGWPPEAKPLLEQVRCEERFAPALRLLLGEAYALGGVVYGPHWVYGGAPPAEGLSLKLEDVQAWQKAIEDLDRREVELSAKRRDMEEKAQAHGARQELAKQAHHDELLRVRELEGALNERREIVGLAERDVELIRGESERLKSELDALTGSLEESRRKLDELRAAETALRAQESDAGSAIEGLKTEAGERRIKRSELEGKVAIAAAERQAAQKEFDGKAMEKETLESSIARRELERGEISRRLEECAGIESAARAESEVLLGRRGEVEARVRSFSERLADMERAAGELDTGIRGLKDACEKDQVRLHEWEVHASGLKAKQDGLKTRLWDEWQLPYEEAAAKHAGVAADAERVASLRKRIQNMGNINMAAPEEYEALTQKHGFLTAQVQDLAKAKDDLREAINKINATTRENFRQTFTDVREHFRRIYASLFEGGEADLVLTQPDNILETGIDIAAQPPGKRLQSISLLSGGEKTLTAIALLFAFFMVRPSPVCMLDEADAALDEANTERFASMLKEFSDKTQFIVVSHSKRTIEAAEQIYGVTMEEGGVSLVISVDFKRRGEGAVAAPQAAQQLERLLSSGPEKPSEPV